MFPVVTGQTYKFHWRQGIDFTRIFFEWSVLAKPTDPPTIFHQNFTDQRVEFNVYQRAIMHNDA